MLSLDPLHQTTETIPITALINTALCVGAGGSSGALTDKAIIRNAQGQLLIPGSQLKGRLRHECEKLARSLGWWVADAPSANKLCPEESEIPETLRSRYQVIGYPGYHCIISQIFGDPILPSRIWVDDLICPYAKDELAEVIRPGVSINRFRHTAEDSKLYFLETSPANAQLPFSGNLHLMFPRANEALALADIAKVLISAAFTHIHALGGSKSAGLGWLTWIERPILNPADSVWTQLRPSVSSS
jgi:CRISPR/Cas system CSM-associated protein Csm3 (group 7 of RAMP superfamily)